MTVHYADFGNGYSKHFCGTVTAEPYVEVSWDLDRVDCAECKEQLETAKVAARLRGFDIDQPRVTLTAAGPDAPTTITVAAECFAEKEGQDGAIRRIMRRLWEAAGGL